MGARSGKNFGSFVITTDDPCSVQVNLPMKKSNNSINLVQFIFNVLKKQIASEAGLMT